MNAFTLIHILISLAGLGFGLVTVGLWMAGRPAIRWTWAFLVTTLLTSVTGFFFPFRGFTPAIGVGILSIVLLAVALFLLVSRRFGGSGRPVFVITSVVALYLNFFVLVVQLFQKTPALQSLAPTLKELPFAISQVIVLGLFVALGFAVVRGSREAWNG